MQPSVRKRLQATTRKSRLPRIKDPYQKNRIRKLEQAEHKNYLFLSGFKRYALKSTTTSGNHTCPLWLRSIQWRRIHLYELKGDYLIRYKETVIELDELKKRLQESAYPKGGLMEKALNYFNHFGSKSSTVNMMDDTE